MCRVNLIELGDDPSLVRLHDDTRRYIEHRLGARLSHDEGLGRMPTSSTSDLLIFGIAWEKTAIIE